MALGPEMTFAMAVTVKTVAKFVEYLEENLSTELTEGEKARLRTEAQLVFLTEEVDEKVREGYVAGKTVEETAQKLFLSSTVTRAMRKTWGFAKKFERARQMSACRYACSPESEAYWAS